MSCHCCAHACAAGMAPEAYSYFGCLLQENGEAEVPTSHAPALLEADMSAAAEESEPGEAADEDDAGVNKSTTEAVLAAEPAEQVRRRCRRLLLHAGIQA